MKIDINKASAEELTQIKHVGPSFAEKIIENRPYRDIYELSNVLGLGKKRMNEIFHQDLIFASPPRRPRVIKKEAPEITGSKQNLIDQAWSLNNKKPLI